MLDHPQYVFTHGSAGKQPPQRGTVLQLVQPTRETRTAGRASRVPMSQGRQGYAEL